MNKEQTWSDLQVVELKDEIYKKIDFLGGSLCGVADIEEISGRIQQEYGSRFDQYGRAISIAVFFPKDIVNELADGPTYAYRYCYDILNRKLDEIALELSLFLQIKGFHAFPVPASEYEVEQTAPSVHQLLASEAELPAYNTMLKGAFSHRMAAYRAGIGWIGKSCSLIHPTVGPRLRLVTVLTDAPLPAGQPIENRCGSCTRCQNACPPKAIKGVAFREEDDLAVRLNAEACLNYAGKVREVFGRAVCGLCLAACPWGK